MGQQRTSFEKTRAALKAQLAEATARADAAFTAMKPQRDSFCDEVDRFSSNRSVPTVQVETALRQLRAARSEAGTVNGHLTEQKELKEEAKQSATDVQYELVGAKSRTKQFEGLKVVCKKVSIAFQRGQYGRKPASTGFMTNSFRIFNSISTII